jgi:hypothetical protein
MSDSPPPLELPSELVEIAVELPLKLEMKTA